MASLDGKSAIVTGASSGIGAAIARALVAAGARVAVGARRVDRLEGLGAAYARELDVTDAESPAAFVDSALRELGGLDILVNNAGFALDRERFWESTDEDNAAVIETNVLGLMQMTRLCVGHRRRRAHRQRRLDRGTSGL